MTEESEYRICDVPESLLFPTEHQTYLTYIYPRDASSNDDAKMNDKRTERERETFVSTLKTLYNEQHRTDTDSIRYRLIEDCHFEEIRNAPNPNHCVKFQLVLAPNRANKDSGLSADGSIAFDYHDGIVQEYDESNKAFNFHKADPKELLMAISLNAHSLDEGANTNSIRSWFHFLRSLIASESPRETETASFGCIDWHSTRKSHGFHAVLVNKYAIGNISGLFVPDFWRNHGQSLQFETVLIGLRFLSLFPKQSGLRFGFNSLGAFGSVNHLHLQFWSIKDEALPIEQTPRKQLAVKGMGRVRIDEIDRDYYPLHALQYQLTAEYNDSVLSDLHSLAKCIYFCIEYLQQRDIAYNLVMAPGHPFSVFLVPRQTQSAFDRFADFKTKPGFPEVSSHLILSDEHQWNTLTVTQIWRHWTERIDIGKDPKKWNDIKQECLSMDM